MEYMVFAAMLLTWQKFLLLLMLVTSCSAESTYYVIPTPDTPCPGEPCHTLSEYVAGQYFHNLPVNTIMEFLPGNHTLEQNISVTNLTRLALHGNSASLPETTSWIVCTWPAGFVFTNISELHISAMAFISCGHSGSAVVSMMLVQQSEISDCTFQNSSNTNETRQLPGVDGGAPFIADNTLTLRGNTFLNNSAYAGGVLTVMASNLTLNRKYYGGGALIVRNSTLNLTGNTFQNNFAGYVGGALFAQDSTLNLTGNTFQNNNAGRKGGAVCVFGGTINLTRNTFQSNSASRGGALYAGKKGTLNLTENTFQNNIATNGGALFVYQSTLDLTGNTFQNNSAANSGGAQDVRSSTLHSKGNKFQKSHATFGGTLHTDQCTVTFTDDCFTDSYAQLGGAILATENSIVRLFNITIENNTAQYGGGMAAVDNKLEVSNTTFFKNNRASYGGGLYVHNSEFNGNAIFINNSVTEGGGGIYASRSSLYFMYNTTIITNNSAMDGGGLLLSGGSKFYQQPGLGLYLTNNSANRTGGAMKVEESNPLTYCITTEGKFDVSSSDCFFQFQQKSKRLTSFDRFKAFINSLNVNHTMYFDNNRAVEAGADLYGGSVDNCALNSFKFARRYRGSTDISGYLFDVIMESTPAISSDPLHICSCSRDGLTNCTGSYHPEPVYPGGVLEVPVIALGQRNGTTPAVIQVVNTFDNIKLNSFEYNQKINSSCNTLKYTIHSDPHAIGSTQEMTLYAKGPCFPSRTNILTVTVNIRHCPPGFQLSMNEQICFCAERLQQFTNTCLVDSAMVLRKHNSKFWVGYHSHNESRGLILHPNCPFDYCTSEKKYLAVDDSDKQCNYNRSGLLCGRCSENMSLALGSSRCLQCSDSYLSLLTAFAFAGIALVLLLLVLRLTVAAGTINGLIFYANILAVNWAIFFQPQVKITNVPTRLIASVLSVFIAWLNLDLGIETCFYNGMDANVKTWMQFAFPVYVWALVGMIIVCSHYSGRMARIFGRNPIAVLATLFLLSYAKLLRTVIAALSFTSLEYTNNLHIAVWLYDGNVRYLSGRHIPLFTAAMACLIFLFLPYTMLLIFSQYIQAKSHWKIFSLINSRYVKPFLDAYHAPYTNKHRYWTGMMLLLRLVLFLISAVNALGDPSVNLLAIASATILIPPTILGGRIYKTWSLGLLEMSFIINLNILAVATLFVHPSEGNQNAVIFTSVGIAFATFTGIVIYHSVQQLKGTRLWRRLCLRHDYVRVPLTDVNSGPENPPDRVFISGSAPTQTVVDMRELREPCMATDC